MRTDSPATWFRLYAEFATDPKVQMLCEADQRRYIMLLCIRCSNGDVTLHDSEVAFQLRIADQQWLSTKETLLSKCLITADNQPTAWDKRQRKSDSSAERVAEHREREKAKRNDDVTLQSRQVETEKERETEKEKVKSIAQNAQRNAGQQNSKHSKKLSTAGFAEFWLAYPKKRNKGEAEKAWASLCPDAELQQRISSALESAKRRSDWTKDGGKFTPYPASWLRAKGWEDEPDVMAYSDLTAKAIETYNAVLPAAGWPEAAKTPFSPQRESAIREFLGYSDKPGFPESYFEIVAETLKPMNGCGIDWLLRKETFLKVKEGVIASMGATS